MELSEQSRRYWEYEYDVASKYMIPLLEQWGARFEGGSMIDVGCGEGGGVCAMHDRGLRCSGFDIEGPRVELARALQGNRPIRWAVGNLYTNDLPFSGEEFDLVVLHDVFEHLEQKQVVLEKLKKYMKRGGLLMITFPPYFSAYGAHQQLLSAYWPKVPFFHLVPFALKGILPRLKGESPYVVQEIQKLGRLKMGMRKFEGIIHRGGMSIVGKQAYLIGPNHIRFGLKPIPAGPIADIPLLREVACTGVAYLLSSDS